MYTFQSLNNSPFELFQLIPEVFARVRHLKYLTVSTITNAACYERHTAGLRRSIYNGTICAFAQVDRGTCLADYGSPLVANGKLIGMVSWSRECGRGLPDGYTRVSSFLPWIQRVSGVVPV